jgi:alpha,alpha-trehalose phosphorylase
VTKQADLVLAMVVCGDHFTAEQKRRNFEYYEAITVRDSSLSAAPQAVMAAEVGHLDLAHDYLGEAALMDLLDLEHNTRDGLHLASLAGTWTALVNGLGGMRARSGTLSFAPRLPEGIAALRFRLRYRGRRVEVNATHDTVVYRLTEGDPLTIGHDGERFEVGAEPVTRHLSAPRRLSPPQQPAGRRPRPHHARAEDQPAHAAPTDRPEWR